MEWVGVFVGYGLFLVPVAYLVVRKIRRGEGMKVIDFMVGLAAMYLILKYVPFGPVVLIPLFAWAVVDFLRWLFRPREPVPGA